MFQSIRGKSRSFWPLSPGWKEYVQTLNKALIYIRNSKPTIDELAQWFIDTFPKVRSEKNAKSYVNGVMRPSGLVRIDKTRITLSKRGKEYLEHPSNKLLFQIFDENVIGFSEIIKLLDAKTLKLDELHQALVKELAPYHVRWTTHAQSTFRLSWLRSMGFVILRNRQYSLTSEGRELLNELGGPVVITEKPPANDLKMEEERPSMEPSSESIAEMIITKLRDAEHASDEPEKYEEAIKEAFEFLGFRAEHRGDPGQTDVIAVANLGPETYSRGF